MSLEVVFVATRRVRDMWGRPVWGGWKQEEVMSIVEKLVVEVREACAVSEVANGYRQSAADIRAGHTSGISTVRTVSAGLTAIRKHFEDYGEVEAWTGKGVKHSWLSLVAPLSERCSEYNIPVGPILIPKPAPELLAVSRETLAVLAEHYEGTPEKDAAGDAALAEAREACEGR